MMLFTEVIVVKFINTSKSNPRQQDVKLRFVPIKIIYGQKYMGSEHCQSATSS